jgi:dipeptidyl aminopeptidase/acylaminoacyl peptidase
VALFFYIIHLFLRNVYLKLLINMNTLFKKALIPLAMCLLALASLPALSQERRVEGNMILEDIPEIPLEISERIKQYQNTRSASFTDWLPGDGGIMISTRFANTAQLHTVEFPMGARTQVTFFDEPVSSGTFCPSPDHNGFLFTRDTGGNEFSQIFWYDMDTRQDRMLSDGESVNFGISWSNRGDRFTFTSTRRNKRDFDLYVSDMSSPGQAELLMDRGMGYWVATDWSPDDEKLIVVQYLSATSTNSYILDLQTKNLNQIFDAGEESVVFMAVAWNRDGDKIYVISDKEREFKTLGQFDIATGELTFITHEIPWDVESFNINRQRTKATFTVNDNGFNRLYLLDTRDNSYEMVDDLPMGQIYGVKFHPEKDELALVINSTQTPGDVYSLGINTGELVRWTASEVGGLDTSTFPEPELIFYETFDSVNGNPRQIPAFVYKPSHVEGPMPVLISIHGGPEAQHQPFFSSFNAFLVKELGIAVIAPNVRGSSGYGKTYLDLDNWYLRENSVMDIGSLIDWIGHQEEYDADRIAVMGGSYGGYMVLSSMMHFNDRIACGVNIVGISNFVTFLENTEEYRRDLRRVEYGDERDPEMREFLLSISPANHAEKITKPLFVIQGANDPRVPASESEQMVKAIRKNEGHVWYMLAKDEGHGFRKKENSDRMTEAIALFLKMNLLGD